MQTAVHRQAFAPSTCPSLEELLGRGSRKGSLLLVEDIPDLRALLRWALEREGYLVCEAGNGLECLRLAKTRRPDLILLNYLMPVMDGLTALRQLKMDPVISYLRVITYSAVTDFAWFKAASLESGALDALRTPFQLRDLIQAVARGLRGPV